MCGRPARARERKAVPGSTHFCRRIWKTRTARAALGVIHCSHFQGPCGQAGISSLKHHFRGGLEIGDKNTDARIFGGRIFSGKWRQEAKEECGVTGLSSPWLCHQRELWCLFSTPELRVLTYKTVILLLVLFNIRNVSWVRRENICKSKYFQNSKVLSESQFLLRTSGFAVAHIHVIYTNAWVYEPL